MSAQLLTSTCCGVLDLLPQAGCDWTPGTDPGLGAENSKDSCSCSLNTYSLVRAGYQSWMAGEVGLSQGIHPRMLPGGSGSWAEALSAVFAQ